MLPLLKTKSLLHDVASKHGVTVETLLSRSHRHQARLFEARREAITRLRTERKLGWALIGRMFNRHPDSVRYYVTASKLARRKGRKPSHANTEAARQLFREVCLERGVNPDYLRSQKSTELTPGLSWVRAERARYMLAVQREIVHRIKREFPHFPRLYLGEIINRGGNAVTHRLREPWQAAQEAA